MSARSTLVWSVRRELWEHRWVFVVPAIVAAVVLVGFVVGAAGSPDRVRAFVVPDAAAHPPQVVRPYSLAAAMILFASFVAGLYYCLDALYGERRDRSVLFWKSMPVSDAMTVLAKACVPLVVIPAIGATIALATQLAMLPLNAAFLAARGVDPGALWDGLPLASMTIVMVYGLAVHALWFAPIYGWLFVVSAWVRRAAFLWAVLPIFAAFVVEKLAFDTTTVARLVGYRFTGAMAEAFKVDAGRQAITGLAQLDPLRFLSAPGLWAGLAFAAVCFATAVRLRRHQDPI